MATIVKVKSDGSSTDYYNIPAGARDLHDLIEHKNMPFGIGNIFKACYRLGEKSGTDEAYDLRKIIFFARRRIERLERTEGIVPHDTPFLRSIKRLAHEPPRCGCDEPLCGACLPRSG